VRIAQLVPQLLTGWKVEETEFEFRKWKDIVYTGSEVPLMSLAYWGSLPAIKQLESETGTGFL
jgi:hypothetical protein